MSINSIIPELSKLDLSALETLEAFYKATPYSQELEKDYLSWKSLILSEIDRPEESLSVLNELLKRIASSDHRYFNAIFTKASILGVQKKKEEASEQLLNLLRLKSTNHFQQLSCLKALTNTYLPPDILTECEKHYLGVKSYLGIEVPSSGSLKERVMLLSKANLESNRRFSQLVLDLEELAPDKKLTLLEKFISSETTTYYLSQAKRILTNLNSEQA